MFIWEEIRFIIFRVLSGKCEKRDFGGVLIKGGYLGIREKG